MLYITSQNFFTFKSESFYPLTNISSFPLPLSPQQPLFSSLLVWVRLFKIPHTSDSIWYLYFSAWLMSLRIICSRFIHVVGKWQDFLLSHGWIIFLSISLSLPIYLLRNSWIVSIPWLSWEYRYLFEILISFLLEVCPQVDFLGHIVILFLIFWDTSILFCKVAAWVYIPISSAQGFPFLHILLNSCPWSFSWWSF